MSAWKQKSVKDKASLGQSCVSGFLLCLLPAVYLFERSDDTRFTGICFGAGGVMEWSNECFYKQTQSLISKLHVCVFLVRVRHFVLWGHDRRDNSYLSSHNNKSHLESYSLDWHCRMKWFSSNLDFAPAGILFVILRPLILLNCCLFVCFVAFYSRI